MARLNRLCMRLLGVSLSVVCLQSGATDEMAAGENDESRRGNAFCRLVQGTAAGAKRCRTCHAMLALAAVSGACSERRCHARTRVLVAPVASGRTPRLAVLSSCIHAPADGRSRSTQRAVELGADPDEWIQAYEQLPKLTPAQLEIGAEIVELAAEAIATLYTAASPREEPVCSSKASPTEQAVRAALAVRGRGLPAGDRLSGEGRGDMLVKVVRKLIDQRPDLPLTVKEVAATLGLTPNYFSAMFRRHARQPFCDYLTARRIEAAQGLLRDLTLSVREVGHRVGYPTPSYFVRQFRRTTGMSPGVWRSRQLTV